MCSGLERGSRLEEVLRRREALRKISLHWHEALSRLADDGVPVHELQMLAGRANITTTERYMNARANSLAESMRQARRWSGLNRSSSTVQRSSGVVVKNEPRALCDHMVRSLQIRAVAVRSIRRAGKSLARYAPRVALVRRRRSPRLLRKVAAR